MWSTVDVLVVLGMMLCCGFFGYFFRQKREKSSLEDYFLAGRSMSAIPAGFSIAVSFMSSTIMTVTLGEVNTYGFPMYMVALSCLLTIPVVTLVFQPRFYSSPHYSVYQFLEERYSRWVRIINSFIFIVTSILFLGVVGYCAAISTETLVGMPFWISALTVGLFSTAYSTVGGLKAVVWTDFTQAIMMIAFFIVIIIKVFILFGNPMEIWNLISAGERIQNSFHEDPSYRYSIQSTFMMSIPSHIFVLCISQPGVQRWKSVRSLREARKTAVVGLTCMCIFTLLTYVTALVLYAFYSKCSMDQNLVPASDKIGLYFVSTELSTWPGVLGICLGSILSGALSTFSSYVNSLAAVALEDFISLKYKSLHEHQKLLISKILTGFFGAVGTLFIFLTAWSGAGFFIFIFSQVLAAFLPLATYCMAIWFSKSNSVGVIIGSVVSVFSITLMAIAKTTVGRKMTPLPSVNPLCAGNVSDVELHIGNVTIIPERVVNDSSFWEMVGQVSHFWYSTIGIILTLSLGYVFSISWTALKKRFPRKLAVFNGSVGRSENSHISGCTEILLSDISNNPKP